MVLTGARKGGTTPEDLPTTAPDQRNATNSPQLTRHTTVPNTSAGGSRTDGQIIMSAQPSPFCANVPHPRPDAVTAVTRALRTDREKAGLCPTENPDQLTL